MKRLVIAAAIVASVAAVPNIASAQQAGIKGGVNFASMTDADDEFPNNSRRLGLIGGVWLRTPARSPFSFQVEALLSEKGIALDMVEDGIDISGDLRVRYIELPLLGRIDLGTPGAPTRLYVMGGAAPAFNIGARVRAEVDGEEDTMELDDLVKSFDLGLVAAAGVEFGRASVEGRYTHGVTSTSKNEDNPNKIKNRVFSVLVGVRLK